MFHWAATFDLVSGPLAILFASPGGLKTSCGRPRSCYEQQISNPYQVVSCGSKLEQPTDKIETTMTCLPQQTNSLKPTEDLLHLFALPLTDLVTRMAGGALVNSTGPSLSVMLRYMWRHHSGTQVPDKVLRVVSLVASQVTRFFRGPVPSKSRAASRSAFPVACVSLAPTTKPLRFSINTWPK